MGRLVTDPESTTTSAGVTLTKFRLAVDRDYKNEKGVREADFFSCTAWRQTADIIEKYWTKGKPILIEGKIVVENFETAEGNKRTVYKVQVDRAHFVLSDGKSQGKAAQDDEMPF